MECSFEEDTFDLAGICESGGSSLQQGLILEIRSGLTTTLMQMVAVKSTTDAKAFPLKNVAAIDTTQDIPVNDCGEIGVISMVRPHILEERGRD